jgi:hypothetical protein
MTTSVGGENALGCIDTAELSSTETVMKLGQLTIRNLPCVLRRDGRGVCALASGRSTQDRFLDAQATGCG